MRVRAGERRSGLHGASLARLAWRNLWRQRRRTLLLMVVVAYATLAIVFFWGYTDGFLDSVMNAQGRLVAAPVLITSEAYHADPDPSNPLTDLAALERLALRDDRVHGAAPRIDFGALLRSPYTMEGVMARGVDPALEPQVSDLPNAVTEGRMLRGPGEIVLGKGLAQRLDVRLGERVAIDASALAGPQALGLRLVGLIDAGTAVIDDYTALVDLADARALTGVAGATGLALDVPLGQEAAAAAAVSATLPDGVRAYAVGELLGALQRGLAAERIQMIPMGLLFSLFAAVTVTTTVVVSVLERTREFGVIVSLGLDQASLAWLVTLESVFATTLGWLVGLVAGYGVLWIFHVTNVLGALLVNMYGDILTGLALTDRVYASVRLEYALFASITIALAALFAALAPARRVRRLNPSVAMRSE
jgi:lipoprotein-releasing system permease protein